MHSQHRLSLDQGAAVQTPAAPEPMFRPSDDQEISPVLTRFKDHANQVASAAYAQAQRFCDLTHTHSIAVLSPHLGVHHALTLVLTCVSH